MNAIRKRRLYAMLAIGCLLSVVTGLVLYAMKKNINLFFTPTQISQGAAPMKHPIRVGGMVLKNSIRYLGDGHIVEFVITDFVSNVKVHYKGLLPDLFREGQGVVVNGMIQNVNLVEAQEVLAKHDAKYMPPEIRHLAQAGGNQ